MAERVQRHLESRLLDFDLLRRTGIFSDEEVSLVVKRVRVLEYGMVKLTRTASDYLSLIKYEMSLRELCLLRMSFAAHMSLSRRLLLQKYTRDVVDRCHNVFEAASVGRLARDLRFRLTHVQFLRDAVRDELDDLEFAELNRGRLRSAWLGILTVFGGDPWLWVLASRCRGMDKRALLLRGLTVMPAARAIWVRLFEVEMRRRSGGIAAQVFAEGVRTSRELALAFLDAVLRAKGLRMARRHRLVKQMIPRLGDGGDWVSDLFRYRCGRTTLSEVLAARRDGSPRDRVEFLVRVRPAEALRQLASMDEEWERPWLLETLRRVPSEAAAEEGAFPIELETRVLQCAAVSHNEDESILQQVIRLTTNHMRLFANQHATKMKSVRSWKQLMKRCASQTDRETVLNKCIAQTNPNEVVLFGKYAIIQNCEDEEKAFNAFNNLTAHQPVSMHMLNALLAKTNNDEIKRKAYQRFLSYKEVIADELEYWSEYFKLERGTPNSEKVYKSAMNTLNPKHLVSFTDTVGLVNATSN